MTNTPRSRCLTFSPLAWLKLQLFLHAGDTEVGGFGISSPHDPLYIDDFVTVRQRVTAVTVEFTDEAVADYFDRCVDRGLQPAQFARIWLHTHPGQSPDPSSVDEETFHRVFGGCEWALMFIIGRTGRTYARLQFFTGPGGHLLLPVTVDWEAWPDLVVEQMDQMSDLLAKWLDEYTSNVMTDTRGPAGSTVAPTDDPYQLHESLWADHEALRELEEEQQAFLREDTLAEWGTGTAQWDREAVPA